MFPLGTVLLPGAALPLHLFEPRYLTFYDEVIAAGREFGVVLIERGFEVGGGEARFDVGTAARAVPVDAEADGGAGRVVVAVGTSRIRVTTWLADDPYPMAMVEDAPQTAPPDPAALASCLRSLETTAALLAERGIDVGDWPEVDRDPAVAVYQVAQIAPLQLIDRQRILETDDGTAQAELLGELIEAANELLELQLSQG